MPSTNYRIKTKGNLNSIYLRFKQGNQFDIEVSTGIKVPKGKWSSKLQKINLTDKVDYDTLNRKLRNLGVHIVNEHGTDSVEGISINSKWLKRKIDIFLKRESNNPDDNKKIFLDAYLTYFINEAFKRVKHPTKPITIRTVQHYQTTQNKIIAFEKHKGIKLKLADISLGFHGEFIEYLEIEQLLNNNTIGGYISVIKKVCKKAQREGCNVNSDIEHNDFKTPSNKTYDTYLKIEEIHKINNYSFDKEYLDNARDWLIISVWTGLRVSDLLTLTKSNIEDGFIKKDTLKTKFPVIIPIHKQVSAILDKRKGVFPRKISDQNYNKYIKEVCQESGINQIIKGAKMCPVDVINNGQKKILHRKIFGRYSKHELISSHIGRRSFATNHYGKLDSLTLMKITGHKTEKQFLEYIKITPSEYAEKLRDYWKKIDYNEFINS